MESATRSLFHPLPSVNTIHSPKISRSRSKYHPKFSPFFFPLHRCKQLRESHIFEFWMRERKDQFLKYLRRPHHYDWQVLIMNEMLGSLIVLAFTVALSIVAQILELLVSWMLKWRHERRVLCDSSSSADDQHQPDSRHARMRMRRHAIYEVRHPMMGKWTVVGRALSRLKSRTENALKWLYGIREVIRYGSISLRDKFKSL